MKLQMTMKTMIMKLKMIDDDEDDDDDNDDIEAEYIRMRCSSNIRWTSSTLTFRLVDDSRSGRFRARSEIRRRARPFVDSNRLTEFSRLLKIFENSTNRRGIEDAAGTRRGAVAFPMRCTRRCGRRFSPALKSLGINGQESRSGNHEGASLSRQGQRMNFRCASAAGARWRSERLSTND